MPYIEHGEQASEHGHTRRHLFTSASLLSSIYPHILDMRASVAYVRTHTVLAHICTHTRTHTHTFTYTYTHAPKRTHRYTHARFSLSRLQEGQQYHFYPRPTVHQPARPDHRPQARGLTGWSSPPAARGGDCSKRDYYRRPGAGAGRVRSVLARGMGQSGTAGPTMIAFYSFAE